MLVLKFLLRLSESLSGINAPEWSTDRSRTRNVSISRTAPKAKTSGAWIPNLKLHVQNSGRYHISLSNLACQQPESFEQLQAMGVKELQMFHKIIRTRPSRMDGVRYLTGVRCACGLTDGHLPPSRSDKNK